VRVASEESWQQLCAELSGGDTELAAARNAAFRAFLETWAEHAERQMGGDAAVDEALRATLATTEERWGRITAHFLGQMLVVLIEHWYYGRELQERLTPIERRLMEDSLLLKIGELQESAAVRDEQL